MTNSPVYTLLKQIIHFDKKEKEPVYRQVSQQIINAIQRNYISKGTLLPGTRVLSKLLKVHRNTAVAIYEELASQGWVEIKPNKGTFVLEPKLKTKKIKALSQNSKETNGFSQQTGFPFENSFHLASTNQPTQAKFTINDGKPDLRLHPVHQFSRWYSAAMQRKTLIKKWNNSNSFSYSIFQTQLCNYLNSTRGFYISPKNIVSTRSTEMSLYIVSQLLIQQNDIVLVGNLSNYKANMIFNEVGAIIKTIPVDKDGLDVEYIRTHFIKKSIRCIYVCSHRDYPTTVTLSAERRLKLLQLAKEFGFAIIEDDFDFDFQYEGATMLPIASADTNGMVIYLGKLGQSLFPSFQTGFVIAPENLISEAKNYLQLLDEQGDLIQQQMLSELINEGEIHRLMKKNIVIYKQRRDFLTELLQQHFTTIATWKIPSGGLAIWIQFKHQISLVKLSEETERLGLLLPKTILYQNKNTCAIRFGFGHLENQEMQIVMQILKTAYNNLIVI